MPTIAPGALGRPFRLTSHEALDRFQTWTKLAVPFKVSHVRSIRPVLIPFYGYTSSQPAAAASTDATATTNRLVYAGPRLINRRYSDLFASAAKTSPDNWLAFDERQISSTPDLEILPVGMSLQEAKWTARKGERVSIGYLPAYEVRFLRLAQKLSAVVGAETGKVSGLKLVSFDDTVVNFTNFWFPFLPPLLAKVLCTCVPPFNAVLLAWSLTRTYFWPKFCLQLSRVPLVGSSLLPGVIQRQFFEYDPEVHHIDEADEERYSEENAPYQAFYRQRRHAIHEEELFRAAAKNSSKLTIDQAYRILDMDSSRGGDEQLQLSDFRQAYRAQLLRYHPDHFKGDPKLARKRTQEVIEAFRLLTQRQI